MTEPWIIAQQIDVSEKPAKLFPINTDIVCRDKLSVGTRFQLAGEEETNYKVLHIFPPEVSEAIDMLANLMSEMEESMDPYVPTNLPADPSNAIELAHVFYECLNGVIASTIKYMEDQWKI